MARLRLQWSHKTSAGTIPAKGTVWSLVRLPYNPRALDIKLRQSHEGKSSCSSVFIDAHGSTIRTVDLGAISQMLLVLSTGRNDISMATIKLSAPGGVNFDYTNAQVKDPGLQSSRLSVDIWH